MDKRKEVLLAGAVLLLVALAAASVSWLTDYFAVDSCLDAGGSFNYELGRCDFVNSHHKPK